MQTSRPIFTLSAWFCFLAPVSVAAWAYWAASSPADTGSQGTILDSRAVLITFAIIFAVAFAAGCVGIAGVEGDNALFILPPAVLGILLCCVLEVLALVLLILSSLPGP